MFYSLSSIILSVVDVFKEAVRLHGSVNVVVNSVGIFKENQWEETIEVNLVRIIIFI